MAQVGIGAPVVVLLICWSIYDESHELFEGNTFAVSATHVPE